MEGPPQMANNIQRGSGEVVSCSQEGGQAVGVAAASSMLRKGGGDEGEKEGGSGPTQQQQLLEQHEGGQAVGAYDGMGQDG